MDAKQLKSIADNHGIEYQKNAGAKKMLEILADNDIHPDPSKMIVDNPVIADLVINERVNVAPQSTTNLEHEFSAVVAEFNRANTELEIRRANQSREVVKTKIRKAQDDQLLKRALLWERSHKVINISDNYELNAIESEELEAECECIQKLPSAGHHVYLGDKMKYKKYFDETRGKDMFIFYPVRTIDPEEQISKELANKMARGFMPQESDYAPPKDLVHRFTLVASEFLRYFKIYEDELGF